LNATSTVETDMSTAPTAGVSKSSILPRWHAARRAASGTREPTRPAAASLNAPGYGVVDGDEHKTGIRAVQEALDGAEDERAEAQPAKSR